MNKKTFSLLSRLPVSCFLSCCPPALAKTQSAAKAHARSLQSLVDEAARKTLEKFADKKLEEKAAFDHAHRSSRPRASERRAFAGTKEFIRPAW